MIESPPFPVLSVSGGPWERGHAYGRAARDYILRSRDGYARAFAFYAQLAWTEAAARASCYLSQIETTAPAVAEELRGLAQGSGLGLDEILALNARNELMVTRRLAECTSACALPERTATREIWLGQNWDWLPFAHTACVILRVERTDGPDYLTFVEAGILAKTGLNAAGLGVCANSLACDLDDGRPGTPYHILLRRLMDAESLEEATHLLQRTPRASSANYLLAHADGASVDAEAAPGGVDTICLLSPREGILTHTNHFIGLTARRDVFAARFPDTLARQKRATSLLSAGTTKLDLSAFQALFRDHANYPDAICRHPRADDRDGMGLETVGSIVLDLARRVMFIAKGPPCRNAYIPVPLKKDDTAAWRNPNKPTAGVQIREIG